MNNTLTPFDRIEDKRLYVRPVGTPDLYEGFALDRENKEVATTVPTRTKEAAMDAIRRLVERLPKK